MMEYLENAACKHWDCKGHWKPEVLTDICEHGRSCSPAQALSLIRRYLSCDGVRTSCGWSLNLLRHGGMGVRLWEGIVEALAAQPTRVIFLTRRNVADQALSYEVGSKRRDTMNTPEFRALFGPQYWCNAFHYSNCNAQQRAWVDQRTRFSISPKHLQYSIMEYERNNELYGRLEQELRQRNHPNITVLHVTYEELFSAEVWRKLLREVGLAGTEPPSMAVPRNGTYGRFVANWEAVAQQAKTMGYDIAHL